MMPIFNPDSIPEILILPSFLYVSDGTSACFSATGERDAQMETKTAVFEEPRRETAAPSREAHWSAVSSGVAWDAVIGGAFVAAALSLILLALGAGLGLSSVSPWSNTGASAATLGTVAIAWLLLTEIVASAMGGYLTGRLRIKWAVLHTDEVYFRDTANGFLSWAVALVITATFLASAAATMAGGAVRGTAEAVGTAMIADPNAYFVDTLFRGDRQPVDQSVAQMSAAQAEAARTFGHALLQGEITAADRTVLARLVAARTGMSLPEAEQRVSDVLTAARQAADTARKTTARLLLWSFLALMMGAFSASYAATIGGRQRDHVKLV
jgi:hypothetical protein